MITIITSVILLASSLICARFGAALLRVDRVEAEKNASRFHTFWDAVLGRAQVHSDWLPDARVQGGMVYNDKLKRIEICGRLSDESVERTFR